MVKSLFITCFFNLVVRNFLETEAFRILRSRQDLKLVLLVPEGKKNFFEKEFGGTNVCVEEINFFPLSKVNLFFHLLSWNLLSTRSKKIHKLVQLGKDPNYFLFCLTSFLAILGKSAWIRKIFRLLDYWLTPRGGFDYLFDKYKPDLIFVADMQDLRAQELSDVALVREAKRRGIASIGMSRSWDAMTTKGLLRILPDKLIVQSEDIKEQAVKYHSANSNDICVTGTPHYDVYITGKRVSRRELFQKFGLDPKKKLILVIPPSDIWTGDTTLNPYLLKTIGGLGEQTVVRFPIFGALELEDFTSPLNMKFDIPKNASRLEDSLLSRHDDEHFAALISHSDVVVTGPSSIILDASVFNKPAVLIGFDGEKTKPYWQSLRRYYDYEHQQIVINRGLVKIANDRGELLSLIKDFLRNPDLGRDGRRRIAEMVSPGLDGRSGERLAAIILDKLSDQIKVACNFCSGNDLKLLAKKDKRGKEAYTSICKKCGLIFLNPRMAKEGYSRYYQTQYRLNPNLDNLFQKTTRHGRGLANILKDFFRRDGLTIEIGSGTGGVLNGIREVLGLEVLGVEPSLREAEFADSKGIRTINSMMEDIKEGDFFSKTVANIISTQSLNHLLDPKHFLSWSYNKLQEEGSLILEVMNFRHLVKKAGNIRNAVQIPHVYMFVPETLKDFVRSAGFDIVFFDSDENKTKSDLMNQRKLGLPATHIRIVATKSKRKPFSGFFFDNADYRKLSLDFNNYIIYWNYLIHYRIPKFFKK